MSVKIAVNEVEFHETPLEEISIKDTIIVIELDDSEEKRWRFKFNPYQAFKVTTADCINKTPFLIDGRRPLHLLEVVDSEWLYGLKTELQRIDNTATFMDKARHFVAPFQDSVIEIVAWNVSIEAI